MIRLENVSFKYSGSKRDVLNNINISFTENRIYGLLGKNGVGKSTMLYIIAGLLKPKSGSASINNIDSTKRNPEMLKEVFIVPEEFTLPNIKLSEYVKMCAPFYPNFSQEILDECLKDFDLPKEMKLSELSMGQKKKVFMSFALATGTEILLMDEPTNGLDIPSKQQFRRVLSRTMSDNRTIIISTHQIHDVEQLLDHIVVMSNDGILFDKSTEEITDKYTFELRTPQDMEDVIYAEPSLYGNSVMAKRGNRPETQINLETLFNAVTTNNNID